MEEKFIKDLVIPELRTLKDFFEDAVKIAETRPNCTCGYFGVCPTFFGNAIQCNSFEIPASAMKIIYEANKDRIDQKLKEYDI